MARVRRLRIECTSICGRHILSKIELLACVQLRLANDEALRRHEIFGPDARFHSNGAESKAFAGKEKGGRGADKVGGSGIMAGVQGFGGFGPCQSLAEPSKEPMVHGVLLWYP